MIIISFLCFDLLLYDFEKRQKRERSFTANNLKNLLKFISRALAKTNIQIDRLYLPDISDLQILNGLKNAFLSILIAYTSSKAVKINADEHFMQATDLDKPKIDLTLSSRILPLGITMLASYLKNNS